MMPRERVTLEPAYVLHTREYRDTSRILDVFSQQHGRLTLFARGARGPKSKLASLLMPFRALLLSWSGRGDAAQLTMAEPHGEALTLPARQVLSGFYLNELIISLTTRHDPQPGLFGDQRRVHRVGIRRAARLPHRRDVIDVDSECDGGVRDHGFPRRAMERATVRVRSSRPSRQ